MSEATSGNLNPRISLRSCGLRRRRLHRADRHRDGGVRRVDHRHADRVFEAAMAALEMELR
jgi:hypothetical protein